MLQNILLIVTIVLLILVVFGVAISEKAFKIVVLIILALELASGTDWGGRYLR